MTVEDHPDIREYVIDSAVAALDGDGRFRLDSEVVAGAESVPVVSASRARQLAAAFAKSYGPAFEPFWEQERGGNIDVAMLRVGPRIYPAQTAFGAVPDVGCHPAFVRLFGSYYLATLNRADESQVRMAVSAQTSEYSVDGDGNLVEPSRTGQDFVHDGIPERGPYVLSPEQAVALAARATGARITRVPRLVLQRGNEFSPTFAVWSVALDRAVAVDRSGGRRITVTTIYVGPNARFYAPKASQPTSVTQACSKVGADLVDSGFATVTVEVLDGQPVDFESVVVTR